MQRLENVSSNHNVFLTITKYVMRTSTENRNIYIYIYIMYWRVKKDCSFKGERKKKKKKMV